MQGLKSHYSSSGSNEQWWHEGMLFLGIHKLTQTKYCVNRLTKLPCKLNQILSPLWLDAVPINLFLHQTLNFSFMLHRQAGCSLALMMSQATRLHSSGPLPVHHKMALAGHPGKATECRMQNILEYFFLQKNGDISDYLRDHMKIAIFKHVNVRVLSQSECHSRHWLLSDNDGHPGATSLSSCCSIGAQMSHRFCYVFASPIWILKIPRGVS